MITKKVFEMCVTAELLLLAVFFKHTDGLFIRRFQALCLELTVFV